MNVALIIWPLQVWNSGLVFFLSEKWLKLGFAAFRQQKLKRNILFFQWHKPEDYVDFNYLSVEAAVRM